jgi:hypothetical protein
MVTRTSGAGWFIISIPSIPSNVAHCGTLRPSLCFYRESFYEQTLAGGQRPRSPGGSTPAIGEGSKRQPEQTTLTDRKRSPLPCAKVPAAVGHRRHHLAAHYLPLQVRVGIVLAGAVVLVLADRRVRGPALQPLFVIGVQATFVVVDENAARNLHRVY